MKCAHHPDRNAMTSCRSCGIALCEECAHQQAGGGHLCNKCLALMAAGEVIDETRQRAEQSERRKIDQEDARTRRARLQIVVPVVLAVLILGINVLLLLTAPVPDIETLVVSEYPVASLVVVDAAIREYMREVGETPKDLATLRGDYLPENTMGTEDLNTFSYRRTSERTYELTRVEPAGDTLPELIMTEGGPR